MLFVGCGTKEMEGTGGGGSRLFVLWLCDYLFISIHIVFNLKSGRTALYGACEYGHESIVSLLLEKGANLDERTEVFGY
jgi:hypothetical protein